MAANTSDNNNATILPSTATKTTFLVIFLVFGLFGNLFLVITIGSNRRLRTTVFHIITLNLAITNLIDCLLNFSFTIGYTVSPTTDLETFLCRSNSFFMNIVTVERPLTLTLLTLDRFIHSVFPTKYVSLQNVQRTFFMILYTWIHALAFGIPLATGLIAIQIYIDLSACLPVDVVDTVYLTFYSVLCFVIPLCAITVLLILIIRYSFSQRDHIHSVMTQNQYSKDTDSEQLRCLNEALITKFVGVLCLIWLLCEFPFICAFIVRLTFSGISYSACVLVTLLWLKFSYVMALPLLSFTFNKDVWNTFKDLILCKKNNSVVDATKDGYTPESTKDNLDEKLKLKIKNEEKRIAKEEPAKDVPVKNTGFHVPVFFANANGVHMHTMSDDDSLSENEDLYENPKVKKCDVTGSQEYLNQCDTSDYDSSNELDPFSVSHPVTSKSIKHSGEPIQRRSSSHPEVRAQTPDTLKKSSITTSTVVDSGIDISGTKTTVFSVPTDTSTSIAQIIPEEQQVNKNPKITLIPGEIAEKTPEVMLTCTSAKPCDDVNGPYSSFVSQVDSAIDTAIGLPKTKKKKRRKDKQTNIEKAGLSHTSGEMVCIKPARLQPLPNSPIHPNATPMNRKLTLDMLSAQQLCDSSMTVATPSACQLGVSEDSLYSTGTS